MSKRRDIVLRITEYLSNGGLFNPELMPHSDVRDLLLACRDEIIAARACAEMMLQGTGQKLGEELARRVMDEHYPPRWTPVEEMLPEERVKVLTCGDDPVEGPFILIGHREPASIFGPAHWHLPCFSEFGPVTHWMPLPEPPEVK